MSVFKNTPPSGDFVTLFDLSSPYEPQQAKKHHLASLSFKNITATGNTVHSLSQPLPLTLPTDAGEKAPLVRYFIKKIFRFDRFILAIDDYLNLLYMHLYTGMAGFFATGISFSSMPEFKLLHHNSKPCVAIIPTSDQDTTVIFVDNNTPILSLPPLSVNDIACIDGKYMGFATNSASLQTADCDDITLFSSYPKTLAHTGGSGKLLRIIEGDSRAYLFSENAVFKVKASADYSNISPIFWERAIESSVCRYGDDVFFLTKNGLFKIHGDTVSNVIKTDIQDVNLSACVCNGKILFYSNDNALVFDVATEILSDTDIKGIVTATPLPEYDRFILVDKDGYFLMLPVMNNVSKYEPDSSLSAEISGKTDFGYPHNLKRIIGFSLYATGDFSLSVSVDGRDPIRYTFPVSNTPVFLPANLTGHSFDIKLTSLSSTNAQIFHLAAKTSLIEK